MDRRRSLIDPVMTMLDKRSEDPIRGDGRVGGSRGEL